MNWIAGVCVVLGMCCVCTDSLVMAGVGVALMGVAAVAGNWDEREERGERREERGVESV